MNLSKDSSITNQSYYCLFNREILLLKIWPQYDSNSMHEKFIANTIGYAVLKVIPEVCH